MAEIRPDGVELAAKASSSLTDIDAKANSVLSAESVQRKSLTESLTTSQQKEATVAELTGKVTQAEQNATAVNKKV